MKRIFIIIFAVTILTILTGCANPRWFWCTSSGIMTYNRHTGQFEVIWENQAKPTEVKHDTVYVVHKDN